MGDVIWGNMPPNSPKMALNRQFQAKTPKYENRNISSNFGMPVDFHLSKRVPSPKPNPEVDFPLYGRHLEKSI